MPSFEIVLTGISAVQKELLGLSERFGPERVRAALVEEAEIEMTEAKRRTPVATGALQSTGHVEPNAQAASAPNEVAVALVFGGDQAPHALVVHEDLEAHHENGQARYLESTLLESVPYLAQRIAKRLDPGDVKGSASSTAAPVTISVGDE